MTAPSLPAALRVGADGLYTLEAATGLIIAHGTWIARDFAPSSTNGTGTAAIDWEAVISALDAGGLPAQAGSLNYRCESVEGVAGERPSSTMTVVDGVRLRTEHASNRCVRRPGGCLKVPGCVAIFM